MSKVVAPILLCLVLMLVPSYVHVGQGQSTTTPAATDQCLDFNGDGK
jgi:hypothetical protein